MDYSFIKGVKMINEKTIEYRTYIHERLEVPKAFDDVTDINHTYIIWNGKHEIYVNGVLIKNIRDAYTIHDISRYAPKEYLNGKLFFRLVFA